METGIKKIRRHSKRRKRRRIEVWILSSLFIVVLISIVSVFMKNDGPGETTAFSALMNDDGSLDTTPSNKASGSVVVDAVQKKVEIMTPHPIELIIDKAVTAINQEYFDALVDMYSDDAVLVIQPGMKAVGKEQIRNAFEAIATHYEHTLDVKQAGTEILETGDTALVSVNTLVSAKGHPVVERKVTYVFKKDAGNTWFCVIDNSYGHGRLE